MKKIIFLIFSLISMTIAASAQLKKLSPLNGPHLKYNDSLRIKIPRQVYVAQPKQNNLPVTSAVKILPNEMEFAYNNGNGFDVYRSQIDGMQILQPDAANSRSLGIKTKSPSITITQQPSPYTVRP